MHIDNVTTNGLPVAIHVEGNRDRKEYDFMMGNMNDNPFKIARVVRKLKFINANDSYFIEIGPGIGALTNQINTENINITAIDIDANNIETLKNKFKGKKNFKTFDCI